MGQSLMGEKLLLECVIPKVHWLFNVMCILVHNFGKGEEIQMNEECNYSY